MNKAKQLIDRLEAQHSLSIEEYEYLIENQSDELAAYAAEKAVALRKQVYGTDVYIRGLIEIGNICRNDCYYCGIRRSNPACDRYRLTEAQILDCAREGYALGFRTFVMQGGEDGAFSVDVVCHLVRQIKAEFPDCAVTLSLGEFPREAYQAMFDAGADRYLLRHETANKAHYEKLHPAQMSFDNRMRCLRDLKDIGYQTGCGFVAVAAGEGLKSLFTDLGADVVVQGGQTMNPSTDDILHAVDAVPAEIVFVLPNNKNIIMAAEQAVHLSEEKKVIVVPTKTIPQGISAMLAVDPEAEQDSELALAMLDAAKHVRSGQVTYAARDSEFDGKKIKQGEYLSLCEGKLCANGKETSVIKKLAREMVSDDSAFATVIFGEGVTEEQAAEVENLLHKENKEMEINVIDGGQPVYYYIISVE